jgi:hypothetical protein
MLRPLAAGGCPHCQGSDPVRAGAGPARLIKNSQTAGLCPMDPAEDEELQQILIQGALRYFQEKDEEFVPNWNFVLRDSLAKSPKSVFPVLNSSNSPDTIGRKQNRYFGGAERSSLESNLSPSQKSIESQSSPKERNNEHSLQSSSTLSMEGTVRREPQPTKPVLKDALRPRSASPSKAVAFVTQPV